MAPHRAHVSLITGAPATVTRGHGGTDVRLPGDVMTGSTASPMPRTHNFYVPPPHPLRDLVTTLTLTVVAVAVVVAIAVL